MNDNREIFNSTIERLKKNGVCVKDEFSVVVALANEIAVYREKIDSLNDCLDRLNKRNLELSETIKEWDETGCDCPCELEEISEHETFISIASHRKISNIEIYFQEE